MPSLDLDADSVGRKKKRPAGTRSGPGAIEEAREVYSRRSPRVARRVELAEIMGWRKADNLRLCAADTPAETR